MRAVYSFFTVLPLLVGASANNFTNSSAPASILSSGHVDLGEYQSAYDQAVAFVSTLTNTQKVSIITGGSANGSSASFTALAGKDGFAGINGQYYVSSFPMGGALAMTWDRTHFEAEARAAGDEFYLMGYNLINGPVAGPLGRTPYGGRMAEGFSPDPYLNGISMEKTVRGMNAVGVVTVSRHFLLNEQETNRSSALSSETSGVYSSNADDKTIHELYLWPFADAVRAGTGAVMCGMTKTNGTLSCENSKLISGLLKEELGFPGLVMPDVNSQTTSYESANVGLDYGSSAYWSTEILNAGISNGSFTQARLDDMAVRNIIGYYFAGLDAGIQPARASTTEYRSVRANHSELIREIARDSLVLLKNENSALPLQKPKVISVFGAHAAGCLAGPNFAMSVAGMDDPYDGHLATGGGSGQGSMAYLVTPLHALIERARKDGTMIRYIANDTYTSTERSGMGGGGMPTGGNSSSFGGGIIGGPPVSSSNGNSSMPMPGGGGGGGGGFGAGTSLSPSYANYAAASDVCLVFLNSASGEGADRSVLTHSSQDSLVTSVASSCNNTIVIINTPGPRLVDNWIENSNITAVLYGSLLGQESGNAITDILYGDANPSGKLTYTLAKTESDYPVSICYTAECNFTEGVYIDYRHFDAQNISVRYPFGHGLSYTTFSYTSNNSNSNSNSNSNNNSSNNNNNDLTITITNPTALQSRYPTERLTLGGPADLFAEVLSVSTTIHNTGSRAGMEVAQLYISYPASAAQPRKQLRGFEKVLLEAREARTVTFSVRRKDVSYWDVVAQKWAVASGEYTVAVGGSSGELGVRGTFVV